MSGFEAFSCHPERSDGGHAEHGPRHCAQGDIRVRCGYPATGAGLGLANEGAAAGSIRTALILNEAIRA